MKQQYTHSKGKGHGKYNGMARANDWVGRRVKSTRQIRNNGGDGVMEGTEGTVTGLSRGVAVTFDMCEHCGTVLSVTRLSYTDIELV